MKVTAIVLRVVIEDRPRKNWRARWKGCVRLRNHIAKCGGLKFNRMAPAKTAAFAISDHPLVRTVRIIRRVETELWMVAKDQYIFAIHAEQAGILK